MTGLASEQVCGRIARDGIEPAAHASFDPTHRALVLMANHGLKLVQTGDSRPRKLQFRLGCRLALLKVRYFAAQARYIVLRGICRLFGEPK